MSNPFDKLKSSLNDLIFEEEEKDQDAVEVKATTQAGTDEFHQERSFKEPEEKINTIFEEEITPVAEIKSIQTSIITEGTALNGNIRTESHVKIEGNVQGNIETTANVTIVGGEVTGDIKGGMIGTKEATIKGNITSNDIIEILENSYVEGNLMGDKIYIAGRVSGNINSTGMLTISSEAVIDGDILTKQLRIEDGSVFNGRITMSR